MKRSVLQLLESFREGGSERQAIQLTRLLHERDEFKIHVACLNETGVLRNEFDRLGLGAVPAFPLTSFRDANAVGQLSRFVRLLRELRPDILHTHDFYTNIFGMAAASLAGVPVRIASKRETGGVRTPTQRFVERSAYRLSHAVVANSEAVRKMLVAEGVPAGKVRTIYNGLDFGHAAAVGESIAGSASEPLRLPWLGERRIVTLLANLRLAAKDHPMFLRAARRVKGLVPEAAFVVAGEGELLTATQDYCRELGLANDTSFTGRCDRVPELLAVSAVCVLSSQAEGFSNAILEYMAAGRPVVATDVGGAREAVLEGQSGYLVAPGDDEAMSERIVALLRDPVLAARMGARGAEIVMARFTPEAQVAGVTELYHQLLDRVRQATNRTIANGGDPPRAPGSAVNSGHGPRQ